MTWISGGSLLKAKLERARENVQSGQWPTVDTHGLAEARYVEKLHPRGRNGEFVAKPGSETADTVRKVRVGGEFEAIGTQGEVAVRPTRPEAIAAEDKMRALERADPATAEAKFRDYPTEPYSRDPKLVAQARRMILSGKATTRDLFAHVSGNRVVYDRSREGLHRRIVDSLLAGHEPVQGRAPVAFFTGGAYASGKGGVVDYMNGGKGHPWKPQDAVDLDPDKIKAQLPEFQKLTAAGDPEANLRVYEEAWDIAQAAALEARQRKLDVIADGVGNTTAAEALGRVASYTKDGYVPKAVYVATPTDVAIHNAHMRMESALRSGKLESIRYIPDDVMRATHARVSRVFPKILQGFPGDLDLYDTNTWNGETGKFDDPRLILTKRDGKVTVLDQKTYDAFLAKANETPEPDTANSSLPTPNDPDLYGRRF